MFPTTGLLDDFTRADSAVIPGPNWTTPIFVGDPSMGVSTNQLYRPLTSFGSVYWNTTFGPNSEVFIDWSTVSDSLEIMARITNPNTSSCGGFFLDITGSTWTLWKVVSNTQTQLTGSATQVVSSGDKIGLEVIGTTVTAYYKAGAGAWTSIISRTDSSNTGAGKIGVIGQSNAQREDNFSGGTVVVSSTFSPRPPIVSREAQRRSSRW